MYLLLSKRQTGLGFEGGALDSQQNRQRSVRR